MVKSSLSQDASTTDQHELSIHSAEAPGAISGQIPKWMLYIMTVIFVYIGSSILIFLVSWCFPRWTFLLSNLVVAATLVALLNYIFLPLGTKMLHHWLYTSRNHQTKTVTTRESVLQESKRGETWYVL